ncbi:DUF3108 domain-containing protein [Moraxella sp. Pampa]|uniref:DUF3108 domain-containing protein n=1 Tax=Moraxella sp. Pampa TaxID=3111978 RepID=UPI002B40FE41|nr:DUF3108 domain-containing protein [Moraxella sp. Pampa]
MKNKAVRSFLRKNISTVALTMSILCISLPTHANELATFSATYTVKAYDKLGTATRTLTKSGNDYHYRVKGLVAGIINLNQSAQFSLSDGVITPKNSSMSAKVFGVGNTHKVIFSHDAQTISSTYKNKTATLKMNGQVYDDLSLESQIRQDLIDGKFSGTYQLVKKTDIETTKFKKSGTSKIIVPAGTYEAIRIDRIHDDKSRATSFWLAPSLDYLPIKVSQTSGGKMISMELTKINH